MHDILLLKRDNISKMVQWKTNRKLYVVSRMAPLQMPLNDLEGRFFDV